MASNRERRLAYQRKWWADQYANDPEGSRAMAREKYHRDRDKPDWRARRLLRSARYRAKKAGVKFELDVDDIKARVNRGVCEATGARLSFKRAKKWRNHPLAPSLDRVNPKRGYTRDNVKLVTWQFNCAKNEYGLEQFAAMALAFVAHNKLIRGMK